MSDIQTLKNKEKHIADDVIYDNEVSELEATTTQEALDEIDSRTDEIDNEIDTHIVNTSNPHKVTKSQVGLGNVDNTSDINKPISTAVQTALNGKANTHSHPYLPTAGGTITGTLTVNSHVYNKGYVYFASGTTYYISNSAGFNLAGGTFNGRVYANAGVQLANANYIYGRRTDTSTVYNLLGVSGSNNTFVGSDTYAMNTNIYGGIISLKCNNYIAVNNSVRFPNAQYIRCANTSGTFYDVIGLGSANWFAVGNGNFVTGLRGSSVRLGSSSGTVVTSDINLKNDINDIDDKYIEFFKNLKPKTYKYELGISKRPHIGFIAQEVEEALIEAGLTNDDFAGICIEPIMYAEELDDGLDDMSYAYHKGLKEIHSLRYEEFISLNSKMIQNNIKEIEILNKLILTQQQTIDNLQNRLDKLEK